MSPSTFEEFVKMSPADRRGFVQAAGSKLRAPGLSSPLTENTALLVIGWAARCAEEHRVPTAPMLKNLGS